jgi:phage terminase Nu1 subunit (DNA packaging protein)
VLVSGNRLAVHFGCVRQYIDVLAAQGVIKRRSVDGLFDMDQARLRFIKHLRERRPSARTEADAEHTRAKTEMLQIKLARERGDLVRQADVDELIHRIAGVTLTALSGMPARCAPPDDFLTRKKIENVVNQVRRELAAIGEEMADAAGEPPLDRQD